MQITERDTSILSQVAFKEAARFYDGTEASVPAFLDALSILTDGLIAQVKTTTEAHATVSQAASVPVQQPAAGTAAAATQQLASNGMFTLSIKGEQHGPIPDWAVAKAAENGVTEVWDNRNKLAENPKYPWFKSTGSDKTPFWPPKGS